MVTIKEVKTGILFQSGLCGTRNAYNLFCTQQEYELRRTASLMHPGITVSTEEDSQPTPTENLALKMASRAFASKIAAEKTVSLQELELKNLKERKENAG